MGVAVNGSRVLLCVTGGIAAYKAASLASALVQRGAIVDVMMTADAERFIGALTFSALTARPVYTSLWDAPDRIPHVRLVREAQVAMVIPATANSIAKLAGGVADDVISSALLAARIPLLVAPAMNSAMYEHPATQTNLALLRARGVEIVEPESGFLAERERGIGRLASEERLLEALSVALRRTQSLAGKRVAVTAGPTREAFDPVRFIGNASTGAQGIALAREALLRGADVTLILGPTQLEPPAGARTVRVTTARDMLDAALEHAVGADLTIAAAAVSDWRPLESSPVKLKKSDGDLTVRLARNPDVLAELARRKGNTFLVGFAAETNNHEANAREKLQRKNLDAIVVNDVAGERAFGEVANTLTLLYGSDGRVELGTGQKSALSARLLEALGELMERA